MNTMKWMLRRELWENKGSLFWAPLVVAAILLAISASSVAYGILTHDANMTVVIGNERVMTSTMISGMPGEVQAGLARVAGGSYIAAAVPLFFVLAFTVFFYCLSALYDERRDRSVLFWKSLPMSDLMTVLSKVATALVVAPLITIAAATAMSLTLLMIIAMVLTTHGVNLFGSLLTNPSLYLSPLQLLGMLPVYALWALPTIGWLLMVSSWARSKPFLWAVGVPVITMVIVKWVDVLTNSFVAGALHGESASTVFAREIIGRLLGGVVPGIWFAFSPADLPQRPGEHGLDMGSIFSQSWQTLGGPGVWIGAAAGVAMVVVAVRMRRWRDDG